MKEMIKKVLFPNKFIGFILFNLGFGLLIYVFCCHLEETPIAYASYCLSAYALTIFCIWFYKICKFGNDFIKTSELYKIYKENFLIVTKTSLYFSLFMNLIYGIFELVIGISYRSWWFITLAIYYLLLCLMKTSLVKNIKDNTSINLKKEYKKLKSTGIILLFLNSLLTGFVTLILAQNQIINYSGVLIYIVALYDFYLIISAVINVIKYRKNHSPILIASKCINLTVAMISMISLEVAMIYQFGDNEATFKLIMTGSMGFAICVINSIMSIYMIVKANKKLKEIKNSFNLISYIEKR